MQATAHMEFIVAAYGAGIVVIGALIAWVTLDDRTQRRIRGRMSEPASESAQMRPRRIIVLVPLILFLGLTALFLVRLNAGDPSLIPSALIGHAVPQTSLPAVT